MGGGGDREGNRKRWRDMEGGKKGRREGKSTSVDYLTKHEH